MREKNSDFESRIAGSKNENERLQTVAASSQAHWDACLKIVSKLSDAAIDPSDPIALLIQAKQGFLDAQRVTQVARNQMQNNPKGLDEYMHDYGVQHAQHAAWQTALMRFDDSAAAAACTVK